MEHVTALKCVLCGAEYCPEDLLYVCPKHGADGILDYVYDYDLIRRRFTRATLACDPTVGLWRYGALLPLRDPLHLPPLRVGSTPLYRLDRLGLRRLWIKDDSRNPTGSLKDRASAVAVARAHELHRSVITAASTGNAAASLAGLAASVGISTYIFVPRTAPEAKIAQLMVFGAHVIAVDGTYDQAFDLCLAASQEYGWYSRNTAYNPCLSEGKKTVILEVCEQLGWEAPDRVFVAVGDGCIMGGIWKGLRDLLALGMIERMPRLMGVQAEGSRVLERAWRAGGEDITPVIPTTLADSIAVGVPRDRIKALRAVRESGGEFITVSDEEILDAMRTLAARAGIFGEPSGVAAFAGMRKMLEEGRLDPEERVVIVMTGSGLKDVGSAIRATGRPDVIPPTIESLRGYMAQARHAATAAG
jgi:threonine synthase